MRGRRGPQVVSALLVVATLGACDTDDASMSFCEAIHAMNTEADVGFEVSSDDPDADIDEQLRTSMARAREISDALARAAPSDVQADAELLAETADAGFERLEELGTDDPFAVLDALGRLPDGTTDADVERALRNVSAAAERECDETLRAVDALDAAARAADEAEKQASSIEIPDVPEIPEVPEVPPGTDDPDAPPPPPAPTPPSAPPPPPPPPSP